MFRPKKNKGDIIFETFLYIALSFMALIFFYPFWQMVVMSFSTPKFANSLGLKLLPDEFTLAAYKEIFSTDLIAVGYMNTLFRTVFGTILTIIVTYLGGYALSKKSLPFRKIIMMFIIFTMFFSGGLIPGYLLVKSLGLIGSRWALILPVATSAWNLIIARNFISTIPDALEEAAFIDGASPYTVLLTIMVPLSMPIIAVLALWTAVRHWNAWFDALIYTTDKSKMVLQLILRNLLIDKSTNATSETVAFITNTEYTSPETVKAATVFVATLPILLFYPLVQKYFVKGVLVGSLKG